MGVVDLESGPKQGQVADSDDFVNELRDPKNAGNFLTS